MAQQQSQFDSAERLARGRALLEAYGANPAQWPREDAPLFETLKSDPLFAAALARQFQRAKDAAAIDLAGVDQVAVPGEPGAHLLVADG